MSMIYDRYPLIYLCAGRRPARKKEARDTLALSVEGEALYTPRYERMSVYDQYDIIYWGRKK